MKKNCKNFDLLGWQLLVFVVLFASSCGRSGKYDGQLTGVPDRPHYTPPEPNGMVYIPSGSFHMGSSDEDLSFLYTASNRTVTVQGFYMDATEITNNEYRQFVNWVKDSIAHTLLGHTETGDNGEERIDWSQTIDYKDPATIEQLAALYYQGDDKISNEYGNPIDVRKLLYHSEWYDLKGAAMDRGKSPRSAFIRRDDVPIYPDTMVWSRDITYSFNEPMTTMYFWHPAFDDYPVVGVNWKQATSFTKWRTRLWWDYRRSHDEYVESEFRLPTEAEWEYAARGGRNESPYPWGGPYLRNKQGCFLANFKPGRGDYAADGGVYPVRADAYWPNDFGLYNMAGNVSEWTSSAYYENGYSFASDLNPDIQINAKDDDAIKLKRKVVRGGSWKDVGWFLQTGTRTFEYQDTAKAYVGFRCVISFLGRSKDDFK